MGLTQSNNRMSGSFFLTPLAMLLSASVTYADYGEGQKILAGPYQYTVAPADTAPFDKDTNPTGYHKMGAGDVKLFVSPLDGNKVCPTQFGAPLPLLGNDTEAYQAAADYCIANGAILLHDRKYLVDQVEITDGIEINASWANGISPRGSNIALLCQPASGQAQKSKLVVRGLGVDGQLKGQLDGGLVQVNGFRDFLFDGCHFADGGDPAGGAAPMGVNGLSLATFGHPDGEPTQFGVVNNCIFERFTKGAINWTTDADMAVFTNCIVRDCAGNGQTPAVQVNGGKHLNLTGTLIEGCEGRGLILGASGTSPATVTGSISGTTLTVSAVASGTLYVGSTITAGSGAVEGARIVSFGTGSGGIGTYTLDTALTNASTSLVFYKATPSQNVTVIGGTVRNCGLSGVGILDAYYSDVQDVTLIGMTIKGNGFTGNVPGLLIENAARVKATKCIITGNYGHGVFVDASPDVDITDNDIRGNCLGNVANYSAVSARNAPRLRVHNNRCSGAMKYGIDATAGGNDGLSIKGNELLGWTTAPFAFAAGGEVGLDIDQSFSVKTVVTTYLNLPLIGLPDDSMLKMDIFAVGKSATNGASYHMSSAYHDVGGTTAQLGTMDTITSHETNAAWTVLMDVTGGYARTRLYSDTEAANWNIRMKVQSVA
jgi:hypothetical protein